MRRILYLFSLTVFSVTFLSTGLYGQMEGLHGDDTETRDGLHAGNQFRMTFFNDGTYGGHPSRPGEIGGEWPINSGHLYLLDGNVFVGAEVVVRDTVVLHIVSENKSANISWSRGDWDPVTNAWWTFLPLPGFASLDTNKIAMSKWPWSWPSAWPDKFNDVDDPGWRNDNVDNDPNHAAWNGYFGKNVFNADEESYFVADDYMNREFPFFPDSTDLNRKGLGIRMYVRGFQWSNALVEDAIFCLFDLENIGTHKHNKMTFSYKIGNNMGDTFDGFDSGDDWGAYDREEDIAYLYDNPPAIGYGGWAPVGYMGGAFLESPGDPYDGIDNDNDGINFSGPEISEAMFAPVTLGEFDDIVLIDYTTYKRTVTTLADTLAALGTDTLIVKYQNTVYKFWAGKVMEEDPLDLVDNNLNGIIDENRGVEVAGVFTYLYIDRGRGYKYIDYFNPDSTSNGMQNPLLEERRDDGIDNDGDWDMDYDDVGADGLPYTNDEGEGDGWPTNGEPHFDKTDIDETDMLGLTSFILYPWPEIPHYEDELVWQNITPGFFDDIMQNDNIELLYGSGYFPLKPGQIERFSMGVICGVDEADLLENKKWVAEAYNQNYNFSKAPYIPTVKAIAGDNKVILIWDDFAEESEDPIAGKDFEGYRIYRSTDPGWNDMKAITDGRGNVTFREPIAQFDLDNDHSGYAPVAIKGVQFYLGDDTGIRHYWVDETAINGYTYYYAVTSYDRGDGDKGIAPAECSKFISTSPTGEVADKGSNVVIVRPEAPAAGYITASFDSAKIKSGVNNTATGSIDYEIIDPLEIKENHNYQITFKDTILADQRPATRNFTLVDITANDTLFKEHTLFAEGEETPTIDGFKISFKGNPEMLDYDPDRSSYRGSPGIDPFLFEPSSSTIELIAGDFEIIFGDVGIDTSTFYLWLGRIALPAVPVNFTIVNTTLNKKVDFAFRERHVTTEADSGKFSFSSVSDVIFFLTPDSLFESWQFRAPAPTGDSTLIPNPGDVLSLVLNKPFLSHDIFEFTTYAVKFDPNLAKGQIDDIRVVPNPYVVTNSWEPFNPYSSGRGPRELHFIHLPPQCTIRIFTIRGQLVNTLHHNSPIWDGTYIWDMLTKDQLDISYGVYVYHIEAEGIGEKIGKFAVIK